MAKEIKKKVAKKVSTKKEQSKKTAKETVKEAVAKVTKKTAKTKKAEPLDIIVSKTISKQDKAIQRFEDYKRTGKILYGEVVNVRSDDELYIILDFDGYDVFIPDNSFFTEGYEFGKNYAKFDKTKQLSKRKISARFQIGSLAPFVIEGIQRPDEVGEFALIGNRVKALTMIKDNYFNPVKVNINDEVKANVLAVFENFVLVECLGVETRISTYNLTDVCQIDNCRDYCKSGDVLDVRVKKIKKNSNTNIYLGVSGRLNKGAKYIKDFNVGDAFMGYVDSYNKDKRLYTIKTKKGTNVSIHEKSVVSRGGLNIGDRISGVVKEKMKDYIIATCQKI